MGNRTEPCPAAQHSPAAILDSPLIFSLLSPTPTLLHYHMGRKDTPKNSFDFFAHTTLETLSNPSEHTGCNGYNDCDCMGRNHPS